LADSAQFDEQLSEVQSVAIDAPAPCERLIGCAGTGKTFTLLKRTQEDPSYGVLTSTTGISAVNLGAITINSTLRYSTVDMLRDVFLSGRLARTLHSIAKKFRRLIVEEYSMADTQALDLWYRGIQEANRYMDIEAPLGILLCGDLAQLPPVKGEWCFNARCWKSFADNTQRLTKVYRQDTGAFLDALNFLRAGDGSTAAETLTSAGLHWESVVDTEFSGTTILPKNDMVNRYNQFGLDRVKGPTFFIPSRRWGKQLSEWGQNIRTKEWGIPPQIELKIGAYVMILSNSSDFSHVNGDCGFITSHDGKLVTVKLVRTGNEVIIGPVTRHADQADQPAESIDAGEHLGEYFPQPHYIRKNKRYVLGQVEYLPLRLAYASTVHKTQSLTLDRVQVDIRNHFMSQPAMMYTALSRCRTLGGLRIVGMKEVFVKHCSMDTRILPWL